VTCQIQQDSGESLATMRIRTYLWADYILEFIQCSYRMLKTLVWDSLAEDKEKACMLYKVIPTSLYLTYPSTD